MIRLATILAVALGTTATAQAQQPRVSNGQILVQAASGSLDGAVREVPSNEGEPAWIGYAVPSANADGQTCCWNNGSNVACRLEPSPSSASPVAPNASGPVRLDGGDMLFVMYRVEGRQISRIRTFSEDCVLDAGGRTVTWLTRVTARDSVALLAVQAASTNRRIADAAMSAIALHAESSALDTLARLARRADSGHARGQALFWLAQRAGQKAVGTLTEAIEKDPETEVKRRAVFALTQLPHDEGVPLLIDIARTHANPAVRKQAIFWLGQTRDARALKFFEDILFK